MANCYLCGNGEATISPYPDERLTYSVKCTNCGEYRISEQAIIEIANKIHSKEVFFIIAGMVFDSLYYKDEIKTVTVKDFRTAKPISTLEKLYRMAKYFYTETTKEKTGNVFPCRPACCYAKNKEEYNELRRELGRLGMLDIQESTLRGGYRGTPTTVIISEKLTMNAKRAFGKGINTAEDFEKLFMNNDNTGGIIITGNKNQINMASDHAAITATQNNGLDMAELQPLIDQITEELKEKGLSDGSIASISSEIIEVTAECNKETVKKNAFQHILSKIKDKAGDTVCDIATSVITSFITKNMGL